MAKKTRIGRPRGAPGENRAKALNVRFKPDERERVERAAEAAKESLSTWARRVLLAAAP